MFVKYFKTIEIPTKLYQNKWKNFGHNRTRSFLNTLHFCNELQWDLGHVYGLLIDADMKLAVGTFDKHSLQHPGYKLIQSTSTLDYYNTRLVRMNYPWKCIGVTHEYWNGDSDKKISKDQLYIQDVGDGGSKSDKFERDIRLLESGILEDPTNVRYQFYLAQSYKDCQKFEKAIQSYKKRIQLGGWFEEVWYSYYMISLCYLKLKNEIKFEQWALSAYQYHKHRAEPIYQLVKYFRETSQHYKAYHYYLLGKKIPYPKDQILFIEKNVYDCMFEWEHSILHYYLFPKERIDGLKQLIRYYNHQEYGLEVVYNNVKHYITSLDLYSQETDREKVCILPQKMRSCEKWCQIEDKYIYQWYPLQIGSIQDKPLEITYTCDTPKFFKHYISSTDAFEYQNQYWIVTQGSMDENHKIYFQIVILDKNYDLIRYTIPFYFKQLGIEYCLGFMILGDSAYFTPSVNDSKPILVKISLDKLETYFM